MASKMGPSGASLDRKSLRQDGINRRQVRQEWRFPPDSPSRTHLRSGEMLPMSAPSVQPSVGGLMTRWKRGEDRKVRHRCQRGRGGMQEAEGEPTNAEGSFLSSPSFELPATTLHACPMRTSERRPARGHRE